MKKFLAFVLIALVAFSASAFAAKADHTYNPATMLNNKLEEGAQSGGYFAKAPSQLLRGTHNLAFGWSDILTDMFQPPIGIGTAMSPLTGTATALARTTSGVVDLLTFWIPGVHGFSV
jgi:hypothetical protein